MLSARGLVLAVFATALAALPAGAGAATGELGGVSCPAADACFATGYRLVGGQRREPEIARWDGSRWTLRAAFSPAPGPDGALVDLSCPGPRACVAAGFLSGPGDQPLAARWDGRRWRQIPPRPGDPTLYSVSCGSPTMCVATGSRAAQRWDGRRWTRQVLVSGTGDEALGDVACASASSCLVVGHGYSADGWYVPEAWRWDGRRWTKQSVPRMDSADAGLEEIACRSARSCVAVGSYAYPSSPSGTFGAVWDGRAWRLIDVSQSFDDEINDISCRPGGECVAVGQESTDRGGAPLALRWDGRRWTTERTPGPAHAPTSQLRAISCPATGACEAVGDIVRDNDRDPVIADRRGRSGWRLVPFPSLVSPSS